MLLRQKGAISIKNHQFFSFWPKQMMFLNKNKSAISKIAPKMSLERGRRYLNIINSAFLMFSCTESFENEIAPLKTHIASSFFNKYLLVMQIEEFEFWNMSFQRRYFVFKAFRMRGK